MTAFKPGDMVVAKLWPELGTGEVLSLTKDQNSIAARVAEVHWPDANQTSSHSFVALKSTDQPSTSQTPRKAYDVGYNIVNQLADLWNVPVDVRQATNDKCWDFAAELVASTIPTQEQIEQRIRRLYIDGGADVTVAQEAAKDVADALLALIGGEAQ